MKPMLATAATDLPTGDQWIYEVKYDGFRCLLHWDKEGPRLFSRNEKELTAAFPEIIDACKQIEAELTNHLPLILDAEIVSLVNPYQSNFSIVQRRGKLRAQAQVKKYAQRLPVSLMVFDLLMEKGNALTAQPLTERKQLLHSLPIHTSSLQVVRTF